MTTSLEAVEYVLIGAILALLITYITQEVLKNRREQAFKKETVDLAQKLEANEVTLTSIRQSVTAIKRMLEITHPDIDKVTLPEIRKESGKIYIRGVEQKEEDNLG